MCYTISRMMRHPRPYSSVDRAMASGAIDRRSSRRGGTQQRPICTSESLWGRVTSGAMGLLLHLRMASRWSSDGPESMIVVSHAAQRKYCIVQAGHCKRCDDRWREHRTGNHRLEAAVLFGYLPGICCLGHAHRFVQLERSGEHGASFRGIVATLDQESSQLKQ